MNIKTRSIFALFTLVVSSIMIAPAVSADEAGIRMTDPTRDYSIGGWNLNPGRSIYWIRGFKQSKTVTFRGEGGFGNVVAEIYIRTDGVNMVPAMDVVEDPNAVITIKGQGSADAPETAGWRKVCTRTVYSGTTTSCFGIGPNSSVKVVVKNHSGDFSKGQVRHN